MRHEVNDLIDRLLPAAAASGEDRFLAHLRPLALFKNGADRQRQLYRETGDWQAIVTDAVARLGDELEPPRDSHALRVSA